MSRGRGRGQKSGPAALLPPEITQNIPQGPPPPFPEVSRPAQKLEIDDDLKGFVKGHRDLKKKFTQSAYFLTSNENGRIDINADMDDGFMESRKRKRKRVPPLQTVMQLSSKYFPQELSTKKQASQSKRAAELKQERIKRMKTNIQGDQNWDHLEQLEKNLQAAAGAEADEAELLGEEEEEEDEIEENDDYDQHEDFQDDEGFEEIDEGDDEPFF